MSKKVTGEPKNEIVFTYSVHESENYLYIHLTTLLATARVAISSIA